MRTATTRTCLLHALLACCLLLATGCGKTVPAETVDGKTREIWERDLDGFSPSDKARALGALARFGKPPLETIAAHLDDEARLVRLAAIRALGVIGPAAAGYAKKLVPYLDENPTGLDARAAKVFRDAAMETLGRLGPAAFPTFSHLLVSDKAAHRARAVYTMRAFVTKLKDGVNTVLPLMQDKDATVRREAAKTLGAAGHGDPRASKALRKALEDEEPEVQAAAAVALGSIGGSSDVEGKALADMLYAHRADVRASAAYGLGLMGIEASPYVKGVRDLMRNDNHVLVRIQAARALYRITGKADDALPQLEKDLQTSDVGLCRDTLRAIGEMGPAAAPAVDSVITFLDEVPMRQQAAAALQAMGPAAAKAVPHLERVLKGLSADARDRPALEAALEAVRPQ
jgi:HEAT repeat protein